MTIECVTDIYCRDTLPSIVHLDLENIRAEKNDLSRFSIGNGLSISTAPLASPTASTYSGPPPPYSYAPLTAGHGLSGYISPPESTTRRSTRDEKDSPDFRKSLPSIHEALADSSMPFPATLPGSSQHQSLPKQSTVTAPLFSEGPKGPMNPFSQPAGAPALLSGPPKPASTPMETQTSTSTYSSVSGPDPRQPVSQHFGYPGSPSAQPQSSCRSSALANTSFTNHNEPSQARSPKPYETSMSQLSYPQYSSSTSNYPQTSEPFQFSAAPKPEDRPGSFVKLMNDAQYSETVKRHLEVFDAELGLNEVSLLPVR